jgi:hypothetical protein
VGGQLATSEELEKEADKEGHWWGRKNPFGTGRKAGERGGVKKKKKSWAQGSDQVKRLQTSILSILDPLHLRSSRS